MPDYSDAYGGKYMKAANFDKPLVGVVEKIVFETVNQDSGEQKPVLYLKGQTRGITLNATRYDFMSLLTGSRDTDDWEGTKITVRKGRTRFAGKMVDCIEFGRGSTAEELNDAIPDL